jgi:membrane associated rhomboid family serine protease
MYFISQIQVLIEMGARYIPCMKSGTGYDTLNAKFICPSGITNINQSVISLDPNHYFPTNPLAYNGATYYLCTLVETCNLRGIIASPAPNQWWRFLTAVGLHGGIIHLIMNLSFQMQAGFDLEKDLGWWRLALIYIISGVGGFMFGAGLSDVSSATVGASGSLYGKSTF